MNYFIAWFGAMLGIGIHRFIFSGSMTLTEFGAAAFWGAFMLGLHALFAWMDSRK